MYICLTCNKEFTPYEKTSKFCNRSCSAKFNNAKRKDTGWKLSLDARKSISKTLSGREGHHKLAGRRIGEYEVRNCPECGLEFEVLKSATKKFCSPQCSAKHVGGYREGSGRSKSGYYKGIYCGSTYELSWVIYRLDNNLPVSRFQGYILYDGNKKYYPDFIDGNMIYEMKGWTTEKTDPILLAKNNAAIAAGYEIQVKFKEDLRKEFNWVKQNYTYDKLEELYDGHVPKYEIVCRNCKNIFLTNNKNRKCCSHACSGTVKGSTMSEEQKSKISKTMSHSSRS